MSDYAERSPQNLIARIQELECANFRLGEELKSARRRIDRFGEGPVGQLSQPQRFPNGSRVRDERGVECLILFGPDDGYCLVWVDGTLRPGYTYREVGGGPLRSRIQWQVEGLFSLQAKMPPL